MKRCSKRAFTLAELIVVLVILAILAAILIPALTGYIKRARTEKDMQMAATLREASQAALTEMYGRGEIPALNHKKENCSNSNAGSYTWNWEYATVSANLQAFLRERELQCQRNPHGLMSLLSR